MPPRDPTPVTGPPAVHPGRQSPMMPEVGALQHSVLICDDNAGIRTAIRMLLEDNQQFAVVGEAVDGDSCLDQVRAIRPDVLILDVNMPNGGPHVARATKQICPTIRILVFSGSTDNNGRQAMLDAGADHYVLKTGRIQPLLDGLQRLFG